MRKRYVNINIMYNSNVSTVSLSNWSRWQHYNKIYSLYNPGTKTGLLLCQWLPPSALQLPSSPTSLTISLRFFNWWKYCACFRMKNVCVCPNKQSCMIFRSYCEPEIIITEPITAHWPTRLDSTRFDQTPTVLAGGAIQRYNLDATLIASKKTWPRPTLTERPGLKTTGTPRMTVQLPGHCSWTVVLSKSVSSIEYHLSWDPIEPLEIGEITVDVGDL